MNVDTVLAAFHAARVDCLLYVSLSDRDMLACQLALPEDERKQARTRHLQRVLGDGRE